MRETAVKPIEIFFMYHENMGTCTRKPVAYFLLLLAILLQGILPFLHAHTGLSAITGIHTPDARAVDYPTRTHSSFKQVFQTDEEASVIKVGAGLSHKDSEPAFDLNGFNNVFQNKLPRPILDLYLSTLTATAHKLDVNFYSSERLPPPTLAPPTQTL